MKLIVSFELLFRDICKLAALFCARNGIKFLNALRQREARNPVFDFLHPEHILFEYFQMLVEAYLHIITPSSPLMTDLELLSKDPLHLLHVSLGILQCKSVRVDDEEGDNSNVRIDWNDFEVVKTIEFTREEESLLPTPYKNIDEINRAMNLQNQQAIAALQAKQAPEEVVVDMSEVESDMRLAGIEPEKKEEAPRAGQILKNYDYSNVLAQKQDRVSTIQKCPICFQEFPYADIDEHIRIELLNPKWREQRKLQLQKTSTTNIAESDEITKNLERLAKKRHEDAQNAALSAPSMPDLDIIRSGNAPKPVNVSTVTAAPVMKTQLPVVPPYMPMFQIPIAPVQNVNPQAHAPIASIIPPPIPQYLVPPPVPVPVVNNQPLHREVVDEPASKKPRANMSESEFLQEFKDDMEVFVSVPKDDKYAQYNFFGQTLVVRCNAAQTFQQLKVLLFIFYSFIYRKILHL